MKPNKLELYALVFTSYIYTSMSGYEKTYHALLQKTDGVMDLERVDHRMFLLEWLNSWGCRQFALKYHNLASASILKWYRRHLNNIIPAGKTLLDTTAEDLERLSTAYEDLSLTTASYREDRIPVSVGPTGAAKLLFALRPRALPPWDDPIRATLKYDATRHSYHRFLIDVKAQLAQLQAQCLEHGFNLDDLPQKIGRVGVTLPKLIDEYHWVVITRKITPPDRGTLYLWYELSSSGV